LAVYVKRNKKTDKPIEGWLPKRDKWVREYDKHITTRSTDELDYNNHDNALRVVVGGTSNKSESWRVATKDGEWSEQPASNVKMILQSKGVGKSEAEAIMGTAANWPWKRVCLPFQKEEPEGRQWNLNAPQFRFTPAEQTDEAPEHPAWDRIYEHVGTDLDVAIKASDQMRRLNIKTGKEYLMLWVACVFRKPFEHLPFLFLYGEENCGKSMFHESLELLVTKGVNRADRALNNNDFNGELAGAILAVVEEINIAANPKALARLRDWTVADVIAIRQMRMDVYDQPNTTHWVYCANRQDFCPVVVGDTRIVVIHVPNLVREGDEPIPGQRSEIGREKMKESLRKEAPQFLATLLSLPLPPVIGRMRLPVIETANKIRSQEFHKDELEQFFAECCFRANGETVLFKEFYDKFYEWLPAETRAGWNRQKCNKSLPHDYPTWLNNQKQKVIGNISFSEPKDTDAKPCVVVNGELVGGEA
jgi:hypothetical protein